MIEAGELSPPIPIKKDFDNARQNPHDDRER